MATFVFKTGAVQIQNAKHSPGKLRNPQDPNGGRWEDSYYIDAAFMGGLAQLFTRSPDVFSSLKIGEQYCFAGELVFRKSGIGLQVNSVYLADGKTPVAGMPEAAKQPR